MEGTVLTFGIMLFHMLKKIKMNKDGEIKILRGIETETGELNHIQMSTWGQVGQGWGGGMTK